MKKSKKNTASTFLYVIIGIVISAVIIMIKERNSDSDNTYYYESSTTHKCVGKWSGSYMRNNGQGIKEEWRIEINNDGTCSATETGSGNANYKQHYTGEWGIISDDCIEFDMRTGNNPHTMVDANGEPYISYAASQINYILYSDGTVTLNDGYTTKMHLNKQ